MKIGCGFYQVDRPICTLSRSSEPFPLPLPSCAHAHHGHLISIFSSVLWGIKRGSGFLGIPKGEVELTNTRLTSTILTYNNMCLCLRLETCTSLQFIPPGFFILQESCHQKCRARIRGQYYWPHLCKVFLLGTLGWWYPGADPGRALVLAWRFISECCHTRGWMESLKCFWGSGCRVMETQGRALRDNPMGAYRKPTDTRGSTSTFPRAPVWWPWDSNPGLWTSFWLGSQWIKHSNSVGAIFLPFTTCLA